GLIHRVHSVAKPGDEKLTTGSDFLPSCYMDMVGHEVLGEHSSGDSSIGQEFIAGQRRVTALESARLLPCPASPPTRLARGPTEDANQVCSAFPQTFPRRQDYLPRRSPILPHS